MNLNKIAKVISAMIMWVSLAQAQAAPPDPATPAEPLPLVSPVFGDNMVLQRDQVDRVWGWCSTPGAKITVTIGSQSAEATPDTAGRWQANVPAQPVGGPYTMTVEVTGSAPQQVTFNNVMLGDVWICGGQSNMDFPVGQSTNGAQEVAKANYPHIRTYVVPKIINLKPQVTYPIAGRKPGTCTWSVCSPTTISNFPAPGYFFARRLTQELNVPIGLIGLSWSGMPAEAFLSQETLRNVPGYEEPTARMADATDPVKFEQDYADALNKWYALNDPNNLWSAAKIDDAAWGTITTPGAFPKSGKKDLSTFQGLIYLRKVINLPDGAADVHDLNLSLGQIGDSDTVWFNGVEIGRTAGGKIPKVFRSYMIPGKLVLAGKNVLTCRILNEFGDGGFLGKPDDMNLKTTAASADAALRIPLGGEWKYRVFGTLEQLTPTPPYIHTDLPSAPGAISNSMVNPLVPLSLKGVIWYQGEANAGRAYWYRKLLPALVNDWRTRFGDGAFPFYVVQLACWQPSFIPVDDTQWPELREAQAMTVAQLPNMGLAVTYDIGDKDNLHYPDKQDVGERLALDALALTYGRKIEYSGPRY